MKWEDVRHAFPNKWLLIEAKKAFTNDKNERVLVDIIPLQKFSNSPEAMRAYQELHHEEPTREYYVLHTSREETNIIEKRWVGVRR